MTKKAEVSGEGKQELAQMLREYPTWGDAAIAYKGALKDAERENERLRRALERIAAPTTGKVTMAQVQMQKIACEALRRGND